MTNPLYPAWLRRPEEANKERERLRYTKRRRPVSASQQRAEEIVKAKEKHRAAIEAKMEENEVSATWNFLAEVSLGPPREVVLARKAYDKALALGEKMARPEMRIESPIVQGRLKRLVRVYAGIAEKKSLKARRVMSIINELRGRRDSKAHEHLAAYQQMLDEAANDYNAAISKANANVSSTCRRCYGKGMWMYIHVSYGVCFSCGRMPMISLRKLQIDQVLK